MPQKVNRAGGAAVSTFVAGATLVKAPFWAIYQGIPLGVASVFSKRAREALAESFEEHIAHPLLHDVPAGFTGEFLDEHETWTGWSALRDILWPVGDPARPADADAQNAQGGSALPRWQHVPELYHALGVTKDASPEVIQAAYRRLAKQYHPDVCRTADGMARFVMIDKAYKVLRDPALRRHYDAIAGVSR